MLRFFTLALSLLWSASAFAQDNEWQEQINAIVDHQILERFDDLQENTATLSNITAGSCDPDNEILRKSLRQSLRAWVSTSAFRFGPTETDNRAFALGFWPDPRGWRPLRRCILITARVACAVAPACFGTCVPGTRQLHGVVG